MKLDKFRTKDSIYDLDVGDRAHQYIKDHFRWDSIANDLIDLYSEYLE